jgi:hypothetical protein
VSHAIGDYVKRFPSSPPRDPAAARDYWLDRGRQADSWGHAREGTDPSFLGRAVGAKIVVTDEGKVENDLGAAALKEAASRWGDLFLAWLQEFGSGALKWLLIAAAVALISFLAFKFLVKKVERLA